MYYTRLVAFAMLASLMLGKAVSAQNELPPVPVEVVEAVRQELAPSVWVAGTVMGRNETRIAAEVEGRIEELLDVGDRVAKDDVIARIDELTFRLRFAEAQAVVTRVQARLSYLQREASRLKALAENNLAAKNRLDEVQADRDVASGELMAAQAQEERARDQLQKTVLRAPFPGVVTERTKRPGERVDVGDVVIRLVDPKALEIQAYVPQRAIVNVREGDVLRAMIG